MKKRFALFCLLSFIAGIVADRLIVHSKVKKMEAEVATAVGKLWGYDDEDAKKFLGILGEQYSPEDLTQLMGELAGMGEKMKQLQYDERLISTLRGLAYLEILKEENGVPAVKEKIKEQVWTFYDDYKQLLTKQPTNEQEEILIGVINRIQRDIQSFDESTEIEPVR
jgi:hypothetical protein|tara:strand:+ start:146 stop:646 length:501 start_codon:yes stop_codon:yes gene_type:complete